MGDVVKPRIDFSALGDLLSIWVPTDPTKSGARIVTMEPDISSFYTPDERFVGIYWFDACRILLPVLERGDMSEVEKYPELLVDFCPDTDVLVFGNREESVRSEEMAENLTAHIGADGLADRFTLENASVILLPHFYNPIDKDSRARTVSDAIEERVAQE